MYAILFCRLVLRYEAWHRSYNITPMLGCTSFSGQPTLLITLRSTSVHGPMYAILFCRLALRYEARHRSYNITPMLGCTPCSPAYKIKQHETDSKQTYCTVIGQGGVIKILGLCQSPVTLRERNRSGGWA